MNLKKLPRYNAAEVDFEYITIGFINLEELLNFNNFRFHWANQNDFVLIDLGGTVIELAIRIKIEISTGKEK